MEFGRIDVHVVGEVAVVGFRDRKLIEDNKISELGQELFDLVERHGHPCIVLDFRGVDFLSSAALGKFITLDKKVKVHRGRIVMCGIIPQIRQVFRMTRLDRLFEISDSLDVATGVLDLLILGDCPVHECAGETRSGEHAQQVPVADPFVMMGCGDCGADTVVLPDPSHHSATVAELSILTYDDEWVRLLAPANSDGRLVERPPHKPKGPLDPVYTLEIHGVLDLFVSEIVRKAFLTVPKPRRLVVDLRNVTDISPVGLSELRDILRSGSPDDITALLVESPAEAPAVAADDDPPILETEAAALAALGDIPDDARKPLTVALRLQGA